MWLYLFLFPLEVCPNIWSRSDLQRVTAARKLKLVVLAASPCIQQCCYAKARQEGAAWWTCLLSIQ